MDHVQTTVGALVRSWREQRRLSQLGLATEAEISQKHLSFIESGRSTPSRDMVLHLAEHLDVPLRERNTLLVAAGYAPFFRDRPLADPALSRAKETVELILKAHEPYPALAVDRHWTIVASNAALTIMLAGVDPALLAPPVNALRIALHPRGLAPSILNLDEWRTHLLERLRRQLRLTRDPVISRLLDELSAYPAPPVSSSVARRPAKHLTERQPPTLADEIAVPLRLRTPRGELSFISTVTVFGTATEITLSEISLEAFYPADAETAAVLRQTAS